MRSFSDEEACILLKEAWALRQRIDTALNNGQYLDANQLENQYNQLIQKAAARFPDETYMFAIEPMPDATTRLMHYWGLATPSVRLSRTKVRLNLLIGALRWALNAGPDDYRWLLDSCGIDPPDAD